MGRSGAEAHIIKADDQFFDHKVPGITLFEGLFKNLFQLIQNFRRITQVPERKSKIFHFLREVVEILIFCGKRIFFKSVVDQSEKAFKIRRRLFSETEAAVVFEQLRRIKFRIPAEFAVGIDPGAVDGVCIPVIAVEKSINTGFGKGSDFTLQFFERAGRGITALKVASEIISPPHDTADIVFFQSSQVLRCHRCQIDDHPFGGKFLERTGQSMMGRPVTGNGRCHMGPVFFKLQCEIPVETPQFFSPAAGVVPRLAPGTFTAGETVALAEFHHRIAAVSPLQGFFIDQLLHIGVAQTILGTDPVKTVSPVKMPLTVDQGEIFRMAPGIFFLGDGTGMIVDGVFFGTVEIVIVGDRINNAADGSICKEETGFVPVGKTFRL